MAIYRGTGGSPGDSPVSGRPLAGRRVMRGDTDFRREGWHFTAGRGLLHAQHRSGLSKIQLVSQPVQNQSRGMLLQAGLFLVLAALSVWNFVRDGRRNHLVFVVAWGAMGLLWLRSSRRLRKLEVERARRLAGECPACGYSLAGNTSGTCPECGAASPYHQKAGV